MNEEIRRDSIDRGIQAHRAGRYDDALGHYRRALDAVNGDAEALSLSGLALLHMGQHDRALPMLHRAVEQEPAQAGFRLNLAEGLERTRQYQLAERELQAILLANPNHARAWDRAGDIAAHMNDEDRAAEGWARAFTLDLTFIPPALKLAQLQISLGRCDLALKVLNAALMQQPADETLLSLKCEAHTASRDWKALQATGSEWIANRPDSANGWRILSRAAFEQGRHIEACNAFVRVLGLTSTPSAADLAVYARLNLHALNYDTAAIALAGAEALEPENSDVLASRALLHMYFGRFAEADVCARRSVARDPQNVSAFSTLSRLHRGRLSDADNAAVLALARRADAHIDQRIPAAFIAGHAEDANGNIDTAMSHYQLAHDLARQRDKSEGRGYDPREVEQRLQRLQELASMRLPTPPRLVNAPRPIFIVGMPRSGTTLVESVLAAHSRVIGLGERAMMQQIKRALLDLDASGQAPDVATLQAWIASYYQDLPDLGGADHVTDKHPLNFESAGLISQLLSDAVIVHVRRDPVETCLSIYRQEFNKHWTFTHRFVDIAHYYSCYARLVAHWERTLGSRFVTIHYEDLAMNFRTAAPQLLAACGLEWEDSCLDFQSSPRPIATFSTVQARDPVRSGNGRAAKYEKFLGELRRGLAS